ncbi:unnamed protein product [Paramecium pentaurelia]|uniref:ATP-dependent RNA helicase n=1 Tax=Paramecium pentaurelia TaxID=43138 RepID=A0A8S1VYV5_9CILI|nr:unnamed protein product [Paramecium pentaurelia]
MLNEFRMQLPIFQFREKIIKSIRENQVIIIAGETGCGKTTQIPQYIYENDPNVKIAVTQPRRVAAMTLAERCSLEKQTKLGQLIGYNVRFDDCTSKDTQITFLTDGMLIREFIIDQQLKRYDVIIIDEAHERTVQSDLLLGLLKNLCRKRKQLKVIMMSATMQIEKFANYLETEAIHIIEARTHTVDVYNVPIRQQDYVESMVNTILQLHFTQPEGDILAFLTGQEDIEDVKEILLERMKISNQEKQLDVKMLYSALPPEVQLEAFQKSIHRKVVLATNIAETSITIDGIVYVVDCGYVKIRSFQIGKAIDTLLLAPVSKAQAEQRAGRAGRQRQGQCYRLYTQQTYERLAKYMLPEILRVNLLSVILQMKAIGIQNVLTFDLIDRPDMELMLANLNQLVKLKALDSEFNLTQHGKNMSSLPLEPQFSHFLIKAYECGIYDLALNSISILQVENLFYFQRGAKESLQKILSKFKIANSDHLTKANILRKYEETQNKKSFCKENNLNHKTLQKAISVKQQLKDYMKRITKKEFEKEDYDKFKQVLSEALMFKHAVYSPSDQAYKLKQTNQLAYIHPESVLFNQKPKYVIYNEVILTKKVYLRDVTEIDEL